jgi:CHASE2 domain-containing sensor protein
LATRLSRQDNLYAICKGSDRDGSKGIAPPPEISEARQGFSDIVKDPDNVLRRHLIAMNPPGSTCTTPYALSAQLAFHYLASSGIFAEYSAAGALQIGDVPIQQLQRANGGYQTVNTWGYQTLINYRAIPSDSDIAPTLTLTEALSDRLQAEQVKDRIVLIGVTAASVGDSFSTPYSTNQKDANQGRYQQQPGVVVQAHMISQILSAVEDGRPLLKVWPRPQDLLWLLVWAAVGGALAWRCRSGRSLMLATVAALSGLSVGCFWLFMLGIWAPLIPAGLTLLLTGGSTTVYFASSKRGSSGKPRHRATHLP